MKQWFLDWSCRNINSVSKRFGGVFNFKGKGERLLKV